MNTSHATPPTRVRRHKAHAAPAPRPSRAAQPSASRSIPVPSTDPELGADQPFEEGTHDILDQDLRYRMISEVAYGLYAARGYVDGFDLDDWLAAEARVDHVQYEAPAAERSPEPA